MLPTVADHHRRRDPRPQDPQTGDGGEARLQERPTGERDEREGLPDIHRRGDGCCRGASSCKLGTADGHLV